MADQVNHRALDALKDMILDMPALASPAGMQSNLTDPPNRRGIALGILITCLVLTTTMTFVRLYVKVILLRKLHWKDYLLALTFVFEIVHYATAWHIYTFDPVLHQWDMSVRDTRGFLLELQIGTLFYDLTILFLKLCILIHFLRIFIPTGDRSKTFWMTHVVIWMNTILYITVIFTQMFACKPIAKAWDPLITGGKCLDILPRYLICPVFNFIMDALVLVWTQKVIWSLHLAPAKKLRLAVLFFAACIFGAVRVCINVRLLRTDDKTYIAALAALYTFPETASGFLVLCLPAFPQFLKAVEGSIVPSSRKSSDTTPAHLINGNEPRSQKRQRKSWWHVTTDPKISKANDALPSESSGTVVPVDAHIEGMDQMSFLSFGPDHLNLKLDCESHQH